MVNNSNLYETPYEEIIWTDGEVSSRCSQILYQYQDFAKYYAFAYMNFRLDNFVKNGYYNEIGIKGDDVSCFVCVGNHNMGIALLNVESKHVVRQMSINYFMIKQVNIDEKRFETIIKISFSESGDYIELKIPNKAIGTKLNFQNQMKENITEFLYNIDKITN